MRHLRLLGLIVASLCLAGGQTCFGAYNRDFAAQYVRDWVISDLDGDDHPDHVNNPNEAAIQKFVPPVGPVPDADYRWFDDLTTVGFVGDNETGNEANASDCTNFISQALIKGGVPVGTLQAQSPTLAFGRGGTLLRARELGGVMDSIAEPQPFVLPDNPIPAFLTKGDIIQWGLSHMTMVVSGDGSNVKLGYHSSDTIDITPLELYRRFKAAAQLQCIRTSPPGTDCSLPNFKKKAIAWHITGTSIQASLDTTPPTVIVRNSSGQIIRDGDATPATNISIEVTDSGSSLNFLEITIGDSILDTIAGALRGDARHFFEDHTRYGASHTYVIDLTNVSEGNRLFVQVADAAGNLSPIQSFSIEKTLPFVKRATVGDKILIDNATPISDVLTSFTRPQISVTFDDAADDVDIDSIKLFLDGNEVAWTLGAVGSITVFHNPAANLADGPHTLRMFAKDVAGNEVDTTANFRIVTTPPILSLVNVDGERLDHGSVSEIALVNVFATHNPSPVRYIEFFVGNVFRDRVDAPPGSLDMTILRREFASNSWHYVRACDEGPNCVYSLFGVFAPGTTPPDPPGPPPPPGGGPQGGGTQRPNPKPGQPLPPPDPPGNPPPPPPPGPPGPTTPPCRGEGCLNEPPAPRPPWQPDPRPPKFCERTPRNCNIPIAFPHDPNAKYGPSGPVVPGQLMTYTIEFENEGEGLALETYIRDALDSALDETSLVLRDMQRVNFLTETETPTTFPWSFDSRTRMITVLTGDAASREGGRFILEARLKPDTPAGTIITNQAVVYFPTVLEVTPTNAIVSAVPLPTQLVYEGASSTTYLAPTRLAARLTAGGRPLVEQPVEFLLANSSWTVTTDANGVAAISTAIAILPGAYNLKVRYPGDGFLYSPQEAILDLKIEKRRVRLDAPFAAARSTESARVTVTLTDDEGRALSAQVEDPKAIYLELVNEETVTPLSTALLSGTSVAFEIALPQPLQITWSVRTRFDGDLRYAASISTGILQLIDETPPTISIISPKDGRTYSSSQLIPIDFSAQDSEDPAPAAVAVLVSSDGLSVPVSSGDSIAASSLSHGQWSLRVQATDWAGNQAEAQSVTFQIAADVLPPRTSLSVGLPSLAGVGGEIVVSSRTPLVLTSVDDLLTLEDGQGLGTAFQELFMDGVFHSSFTNPAPATGQLFTTTFTLSTDPDGVRILGFLAQDTLGNREAVKIGTVVLDATPPGAALLSPSHGGRGMDQVFGKGSIPVIASASDAHFKDFALEFATGKDATAGFMTLAAGTEAVSASIIAHWDTSGLSGFFTLKLTATDLVDNAAISTATVFIGDPSLLLTLENAKTGKKLLERPEGAAVDGQGHIYVANTGKDEVLKFSPQGEFLATFDGLTTLVPAKPDKGKGKDKDDDDGKGKSETIRFAQPSGVALDASGSIYVADRNNNRIAVLDSTGTVLRSVGRTHPAGRFLAGKGPGEFNKPTGVAVSATRIAVADRNNERVQVFNAAFNFLHEIKLPAPPSGSRDDDDEDEEDDGDGDSKPFGVALDLENNVYVSDEENGHFLAFDPQGGLLFVLGKEGKALGEFKNPKGLAASPLKYLYAADRGNKRVQKIDPFRNSVLAFGATFGLHQPAGMALDAAVNLYATDRKENRVLKFGLPDETVVVSLPSRPKEKRGKVDHRGGKVEREDRSGVRVPEGALKQEVEISVEPEWPRPAEELARKADKLKERRLATASEAVEYGPEGTQFEKPVTISLAYDPEKLPQGVKEDELKVYYWNPKTGDWEKQYSVVNKTSHTVDALVGHFSLYQVLGLGSSGIGVTALDDAGLRAGYAFPNPSRGGAAVTFRLQPGVIDAVSVRVFDLSGRKIHSSSDFRYRGVFDDGNGLGGQHSYDHIWDVSGVGSGVYRYIMEAERTGQEKVRKAGKVGVIR